MGFASAAPRQEDLIRKGEGEGPFKTAAQAGLASQGRASFSCRSMTN
jgi:hypothetical protein